MGLLSPFKVQWFLPSTRKYFVSMLMSNEIGIRSIARHRKLEVIKGIVTV